MGFFKKLFDPTAGEIKRLQKIVDKIDSFEEAHKKLTDSELRDKTAEFRARLEKGETLDQLLPEAYSVVREATYRVTGKRQFRVQMMGGIVLHQGRIAEMKTGEGKTLTATMPAYLNALTGNGVHVVTVNDYLAKFQGEDVGRIFKFLGMTVGVIVHDLDQEERRRAYACDVTYGTNNEMGFDYLRDNMVIYQKNMVQRGHNFAIVDEVDSILIDEARTPLIISGAGEKSTDMYEKADRFVCTLKEGVEPEETGRFEESPYTEEEIVEMRKDYVKDEKKKTCNLSEAGVRKAEAWFGVENLSDAANNELVHHINAALRAHSLMKRDVDYVVQNDQVVIVDEFTGRLMVGRRYSDGLHQAIEAKEHVKVERESKTLATVTFQNYFRMYKKLSGMTGTAKTEEDEFKGIYSLDVVQIPTNRPMIRKDMNDLVYTTVKGKFLQVVDEIEKRHKTGQPILVGTVSVEVSELLSKLLKMRGIQHEVLNAKYHEKEAEIVAQAGHYGAVTIATNMAGRGTDILLGGNPEYLARRAMKQKGYDDMLIEEATGFNENVPQEVLDARVIYKQLYAEFKKQTDSEHDRVVEVGGLHIIGTERHESRRIDNQLRGRAGRQGDPGSSQFFISMQDDLMRLFGSDKVSGLIAKMGVGETEAIEAGMLTGLFGRIETTYYTGVVNDPDLVNRLQEAGVTQYKAKASDTMGLMIMNFLLTGVFPIVLMLAVMSYLFKKMSKGGGGIMGVGKSNAKMYVQKETGVTFKDVAGQDEAKESLQEVVDFLHNPKKYTEIGAKLPKGALLVGPPGTGKTLLAKAVAGEAKVPFFSLSGSEFVEMYVGVGASRVRDLFKQAQGMAPCIIFIDEIDAIGKSRDNALGSNDEREQTLNQLLSEMDGFSTDKGLLLLAATNRPEVLDPALLRPGRFDRRIIVDKPDLKGRVDVLKVHAKDVKMDETVDLEAIALATSGAVGSDLANMINEAAITAVKHGRHVVSQADLLEAVEVVLVGKEKKDRIMNDEERRIVSYHEVGHALVSALQKDSEPVQKITIVPRTMGALGYVMHTPEEEKFLNTKSELEAMLVGLLAGRAAEEIVFDTVTTGASNDIEQATRLARAMVTQYGMSEKFGLMGLESVQHRYLDGRAVLNCGEATAAEIDSEVMTMLKNAYQKAKELLSENRQVMDKIAEFLIEKETITGKEFMEIFRKAKGIEEETTDSHMIKIELNEDIFEEGE